MTENPGWLPDLVCLEDYHGDWGSYFAAVYAYFRKDFVESKPYFQGRRLGLKRHPLSQGKEATFWHMISKGKTEEERTPDFRRCERIRWPRPVIENNGDNAIKWWRNKRGRENRICLWLEREEYLVILADRGNYILPWTAYMVTWPNQKRKLQKEYEEFLQNTP